MGKRDARVDAYVEKAADFAKPILNELRDAVHAACPDVEEDMKWRFPHFMYNGMLCSMAAFKQHAAFGFWKGSLILGEASKASDAMGHLGRLTKVSDLPPRKALAGYIKRAMALNDAGVNTPRTPKRIAKPLKMPPALVASLGRNKKASTAFAAFPPSHKREYVEWITEAKTDLTRSRRIDQAVEWIAGGKSRNWKYERKSGGDNRR